MRHVLIGLSVFVSVGALAQVASEADLPLPIVYPGRDQVDRASPNAITITSSPPSVVPLPGVMPAPAPPGPLTKTCEALKIVTAREGVGIVSRGQVVLIHPFMTSVPQVSGWQQKGVFPVCNLDVHPNDSAAIMRLLQICAENKFTAAYLPMSEWMTPENIQQTIQQARQLNILIGTKGSVPHVEAQFSLDNACIFARPELGFTPQKPGRSPISTHENFPRKQEKSMSFDRRPINLSNGRPAIRWNGCDKHAAVQGGRGGPGARDRDNKCMDAEPINAAFAKKMELHFLRCTRVAASKAGLPQTAKNFHQLRLDLRQSVHASQSEPSQRTFVCSGDRYLQFKSLRHAGKENYGQQP